MIRGDIDRAIAASLTRQEFFQVMEQMGYTITTHGKSGAPLKHPKLTPPDAGKNYRFDTLGEDYTLERILERIYSNTRRTPAFGKRKITCTYQRAARYEIMEWEVAERFGKWRNVPEYSETALEG